MKYAGMSVNYEAGFARGEREAFADKANGRKPKAPPEQPASLYRQGYWDAYMPRSSTWWINQRKVAA